MSAKDTFAIAQTLRDSKTGMAVGGLIPPGTYDGVATLPAEYKANAQTYVGDLPYKGWQDTPVTVTAPARTKTPRLVLLNPKAKPEKQVWVNPSAVQAVYHSEFYNKTMIEMTNAVPQRVPKASVADVVRVLNA